MNLVQKLKIRAGWIILVFGGRIRRVMSMRVAWAT